MTEKITTLPTSDEVFQEIERLVEAAGMTITDFVRSQRLAESTWYRWRTPNKEKRQKCPYDVLRGLLLEANRLRNSKSRK